MDAATLLLAAVRRAGAPRVAVAARRAGIMAGMAVLAGVLLLAALGCALAALWIDVAPQLGQAGAALVVAGCLLVLGLAALAVMRRRPTRMPASAPAPIPLDALMRDNKAALLTAALVAGLYAGLNGRPR